MTDRFQFGAAVRSRSWEWLFALRKRLNVDLQLVDDAQAGLLSAASLKGRPVSPDAASGESGTAAVDSILSDSAPGIRLAISTALRTRSPQAASVDRLQTVVIPVTFDRAVSGALIVARRTPDDLPPERVRSELELAGYFLTNAIEAHLQSPPATQGDMERLSALCGLLADEAAQRSDRQIVSAFVESLAVWHDLEAYGYVETARADFVRDIALPGADLTRTPAVIAGAALPDVSRVTRLAKLDIDRMGFTAVDDMVLARVGEGAGSWLVAIAGSIQSEDLERLGVYVSLLDQSVGRAIQSSIAQVLATLGTHLLGDPGDPVEQAREALQRIEHTLHLSSSALIVTTATGAPIVHAGSSFTAAELLQQDAGRLVIIRRDPKQYAMALVGEWSDDHHLTQQEQQIAHAAADLLESWVRRLVRQPQRVQERRASRHGFDQVLERVARHAIEGGTPVAAAVISFADAVSRPDVTQSRAARLREHVRGSDLVGRLGDSEVGVLFYDTPATHTDTLTTRLRQLLEAQGVPLSQVSVGIAARRPGEPMTQALAEEARTRASLS